MVTDGTLADISSRCDGRGPGPVSLARCKQLLSRVPTAYTSLNNGLQTLQFQSLSVNPANKKDVQGGTQDNGTFETTGSSVTWPQTIFGDGGLSGFDATDKKFRFHTYFAAQVDVNFNNGHGPPGTGSPTRSSSRRVPGRRGCSISDHHRFGCAWNDVRGPAYVWRTKDQGGPQVYLDSVCNEFTGRS
jgi:hypothetical protein